MQNQALTLPLPFTLKQHCKQIKQGFVWVCLHKWLISNYNRNLPYMLFDRLDLQLVILYSIFKMCYTKGTRNYEKISHNVQSVTIYVFLTLDSKSSIIGDYLCCIHNCLGSYPGDKCVALFGMLSNCANLIKCSPPVRTWIAQGKWMCGKWLWEWIVTPSHK